MHFNFGTIHLKKNKKHDQYPPHSYVHYVKLESGSLC